MLDNKMAAVLLLFTIFNVLLMVSCQDAQFDCSEHDMRKPPRFGKRSASMKWYWPCPEKPTETKKTSEELDIKSLKSLLNKLRMHIKKAQEQHTPFKLDMY